MNPTHRQSNHADLLASYWGKADPASAFQGGATHHTVLGHCLDVAACAYLLTEKNPILRARLGSALGLSAEAVCATAAALCCLHDVGKLDTRFQRKAPVIADLLRPHTVGITLSRYDHGTEGFRQLEADQAGAELVSSLLGPAGLAVLRAVCGHHGVLPITDDPDPGRAQLPRSVRREDVEARTIFATVVCAFFVELGAQLPLPGAVDGPGIQRLAGLCAVADWLGSNVDFFAYRPGPICDLRAYWADALERAERACRSAGLLRAAAARADFGVLFPGYTPRDVQLLTERISTEEPSLVIVEAEMGKGKTEAALSTANRFLSSELAEGITVALPTMATSNAMFMRVEECAQRMFPGQRVQLALAHSRATRTEGFQAVMSRALVDPDATEASLVCARWLLNKKRILLAQVGVGTVDQALQAALIVPHQFVRMFGLSRNVLIIDEVHAYDAYMEVLLDHLVAWLGALEVPVILLSATLPSERRAALVRAWRGEAPSDRSSRAGDDLATAQAKVYPLVTVATASGVSEFAGETSPSTRTVQVVSSPAAGTPQDALPSTIQRMVSVARAGGRVVWIRNTVGEAQEAYATLTSVAGGVEHMLFHARFRGCDRSAIESGVLERFGKRAPTGGRILIATQVVEQSLDLDFDELHTDLAPVDLILQRTGRLHRHERARPAGYERPRLIVHMPSGADAAALKFGPSAYVYDVGTLWIAARALQARSVLRLPEDIRELVEETYHPDSRAALLESGGPQLVAAEAKRAAELEARRTKARRCCIAPTHVDPSGEGALEDDDDTVQAFTRDGQSATLLPLAWTGDAARLLDAGPYSAPLALDGDGRERWDVARDLLDHTLSIPARGAADVDSEPDEGDPKLWAAWRTRFARFADETGLGRRLAPLPMRLEGQEYVGQLKLSGKWRRVRYSRTFGLVTRITPEGTPGK